MGLRIIGCLTLLMLVGSLADAQRTAQQDDPCSGATKSPSVNWPSYRHDPCNAGYNRDEHILGVDNVRNLVVKWRYQTGNSVFGSPAVVNGIVYMGSLDQYLYALNADTGVLVWKYKTGGQGDSSPAVVDEQWLIRRRWIRQQQYPRPERRHRSCTLDIQGRVLSWIVPGGG